MKHLELLKRSRQLVQASYARVLGILNRKIGRLFVGEIVLVLSVVSYTLIFSYTTIIRLYSFHMHAWDLGNYNQAMYNTLSGDGLLHYTADLPANPSGSILGVHFSIILFLILPFYALAPRPETLLTIQSVFLAIGALPIYGLALAKLGSRPKALALATVYLTNPAIQGVNWVEFHPEGFIPAFSLLSLYFLEKKNWGKYFGSTLLTLSTMEPAAFLVLLTGVYYGWRNRTEIRRALGSRNLSSTPLRVATLTVLMSIVWLTGALYSIRQLNPSELTLFGGLYTWQTLGANSLLAVPVTALLNPASAIAAFLANGPQKLGFILAVFGPLGFLPFAALSITAVGFAWLGVALLSDNPVYYSLATQYPAFIIPYAIAAAVHTSRKLTRRGFQVFALYAIVSSAFLSPLALGGLAGHPYSGPYGFPSVNTHDMAVLSLASLVPSNASILTQDNIFPLLSGRYDAYVVPTRSFFPVGTSFQTQLTTYIQKVSYVLIDPFNDPASAYLVFLLLKPNGFALQATADGALLFARDYSGSPQVISNYIRTYNYTNLSLLCCRSAKDPESVSHWVFSHESTSGISGDFWTGPWVLLPPGNYRLDFRLRLLASTSDYVLTLGVVSYKMNVGQGHAGIPGQGVALSFPVYPDPLPTSYSTTLLHRADFATTQYVTISLSFTSDNFRFFIFPGMNVSSSADIRFDNIILTQESPPQI